VDAPDLNALNDDDYTELLTAHVVPRTRDQAFWDLATSPAHIARTRELLGRVHQRTTNTLRRRKAEREEFHQECRRRGEQGKQEWFESGPQYETWRRKAVFFHQAVQAAIAEIARMQKDQNRAKNHLNRDQARDALRLLAIGVQRHQALHAKAGTMAAQEDYELWHLLDRLTVPCGPNQEPTSLRTMLDFYWTDVEVVTDADHAREAAEKTMRQAPAGRASQFSGVPKARHVGGGKDLAS
jgi:hypothetical protein